MKVAIVLTDQSFQRTKSVGIFNVSMGLARGLMNCPQIKELHILGNNECQGAFVNCPEHVHVHLTQMPVPRKFARVWWDQIGVCRAIRKINPDWVILPKGMPPLFPRFGKAKMACYVHDVIWEYYDKLSRAGKNPFPLYERIYFRTLGNKALRSADIVLTSTQFNKSRFEAHCKDVNTAVIGIGFDQEAKAPQKEIKKGNVIFFASTFPHKLTNKGVEFLSAWLEQREDKGDIKIHVLGKWPQEIDIPGKSWLIRGRINQQELIELMKESCLSFYFSEYEGFGMPPVECLLSGIPCLASDIPPIKENIPAQYLFNNEEKADFIAKANSVYDGQVPFVCPNFPDWQTVSQRCAEALQKHS